MANPVIAAITTYDDKVSATTTGAVREFWIRIPGLSAAAAATSAGNLPMYYLLNPFNQDMVVFNALLVVTTVDATGDAVISVGLGNDATGASLGAEILSSFPNDATGVYEGTVAQAIACTGSKCIWKKPGTSTDSYLVVGQDGNLDATALRWHLLLKLIPYEDLIGDEGTQATVTTA